MNDIVVGRILRALRRRRGWRQIDLAIRAGLSQSQVSALERGHLEGSSLTTVRAAFTPLETRVDLVASWRGADLDRLLDEDHARVVGTLASRLEAAGWTVALEVTYSEFGERGSIDILGLHAARRACLVVEVKTAIASSEAIGRKLDEKARLAPTIVERRWDWRPVAVGRVLALPDTMRLRRLVEREAAMRRMLPAAAADVRRWLRDPSGVVAGIWFLSDSSGRAVRGGSRLRVRVPAARSGVARAVATASARPNPLAIRSSTAKRAAR